MTEKRFFFVIDNGKYTFYDLSENGEIMNMNETEDMLNELNDENEQLKAQLYYNGESVCNICKYQYLVETEKYYVAKCKKGYEKCSKEDVKHCKDFKFKELQE